MSSAGSDYWETIEVKSECWVKFKKPEEEVPVDVEKLDSCQQKEHLSLAGITGDKVTE